MDRKNISLSFYPPITRQALHAFVPGARLQREDAAQLQQRLDAVSGELHLGPRVVGNLWDIYWKKCGKSKNKYGER